MAFRFDWWLSPWEHSEVFPDQSDGTAPGVEFGETIADDVRSSPGLSETVMAELMGGPSAPRSRRAKPEPLRAFGASSARRDVVLLLGGSGAGKTVFTATLYQQLWSGARVVRGRVAQDVADGAAERATRTIRGKARHIATHHELLRIAEDLAAGKWPAASVGISHVEVEVTLDGETELVSIVDYPGAELDRAINWQGSDPLSTELIWLAENASAFIVFIDPDCIAAGGAQWDQDRAAIAHAIRLARRGAGREQTPVAIIVPKADRHKESVTSSGSARGLLAVRDPVLADLVQPAAYWPTSCISAVATVGGWLKPKRKRPPINVVEPLLYCLATLERQREFRKRMGAVESSLRDIEPFLEAARQQALLEAQAMERRLPQFIRACVMLVAALLFLVLSLTVLRP
jgi:hypothetical protein